MEIETVMSYISNSVNPDGVRAQEIIESLNADIQEELGHAQQFAAHQGALRGRPRIDGFHGRAELPQPPEHQTDVRHQGRHRAETGAIEHYLAIIEATEGVDPVTNDMVIAILRDEGHRRLFGISGVEAEGLAWRLRSDPKNASPAHDRHRLRRFHAERAGCPPGQGSITSASWGLVAHGDVRPDSNRKSPPAATADAAILPRSPDDRPAEELARDGRRGGGRRARRSRSRGVLLTAQRQPVLPLTPLRSSSSTARATCDGQRSNTIPAWIASCGRPGDVGEARLRCSRGRPQVLGDDDPLEAASSVKVDVVRTPIAGRQLSPRDREAHAARRARTRRAVLDVVQRRDLAVSHTAEVGRRVCPALRTVASTNRRRQVPRVRRSRASSSISFPARLSEIGAWRRSRWPLMTVTARKLPIPSEGSAAGLAETPLPSQSGSPSSPPPPSAASPMLNDVALSEQHRLGRSPATWFAPQQEL